MAGDAWGRDRRSGEARPVPCGYPLATDQLPGRIPDPAKLEAAA
jgi:hypothetical protein